MEIDIIAYTDAQYASLTAEQLLEVRAAQIKKNKLTAKLEEDIRKAEENLVDNGTYLSSMRTAIVNELQEEYDTEVEILREGLLFFLRFSSRPDASGAPYTVDYSLPVEDRFAIVKTYYETNYSDGNERFAAFQQDTVAVQYLGELYAPLYDYFLDGAN